MDGFSLEIRCFISATFLPFFCTLNSHCPSNSDRGLVISCVEWRKPLRNQHVENKYNSSHEKQLVIGLFSCSAISLASYSCIWQWSLSLSLRAYQSTSSCRDNWMSRADRRLTKSEHGSKWLIKPMSKTTDDSPDHDPGSLIVRHLMTLKHTLTPFHTLNFRHTKVTGKF